MKTLHTWLTAVLTATIAGAILGTALAAILQRIDLDMVVISSRTAGQGWRLGLLCGTILGAAAVIGKREASRPGTALMGGMLVALAATLGAAALALASYLFSKMELIRLPASLARQAGHPYRTFFCYGLEWGALAGTLVGLLVAVALIWCGRLPGSTAADAPPPASS